MKNKIRNKIRSRAYFKIKRSINSCETAQQLDTALTMIAAHPSIEEINALHAIYNQQVEALQSPNAGTERGMNRLHPCASTFENETLTEIQKKNCEAKRISKGI